MYHRCRVRFSHSGSLWRSSLAEIELFRKGIGEIETIVEVNIFSFVKAFIRMWINIHMKAEFPFLQSSIAIVMSQYVDLKKLKWQFHQQIIESFTCVEFQLLPDISRLPATRRPFYHVRRPFWDIFLIYKSFLSDQVVSGSSKDSYRKLRVYTFRS